MYATFLYKLVFEENDFSFDSFVTKVFNHSETKGAYNLCDLSSKEDAIYKNWKLEEELQAEGLMIKFDFDPATESLKETHIRVDDPNDHAETYTYTVDIFSVEYGKWKNILQAVLYSKIISKAATITFLANNDSWSKEDKRSSYDY
uniref:Uncharacterized protein n=1 Tax=Wuchereria bancrofti TaxID=6293 RepID=A0A1I8E9U4_WUCBA